MDSCIILWIDDEIDSLTSHIMFLRDKGFSVNTVSNGYDAIEMVSQKHYDKPFQWHHSHLKQY